MEVILACHDRNSLFCGKCFKILVEEESDTFSAAFRYNDYSIDIDESIIPLSKPEEIRTVVVSTWIKCNQESCYLPLKFYSAKIHCLLVEVHQVEEGNGIYVRQIGLVQFKQILQIISMDFSDLQVIDSPPVYTL